MAATNRRILVKAISWRIISTATTFLLTYLLTGSLMIAGQLASINFVLKTIMQFMHEKLWQRIEWGKGKWLKKRMKEKANVVPMSIVKSNGGKRVTEKKTYFQKTFVDPVYKMKTDGWED